MMIRLWLVVMLLSCSLLGHAQYNELKFEHLLKEDGLSCSDVTSVVQDKQGFIWVGTIDGLNRYDGYNVKTYRNDPEDSTSLCDNKISVLFVDHQGVLWIGTENSGLSRYNKNTDSFTNFAPQVYDEHSLSYHYVTSITEDATKQLWVGTLWGLNKFDRKEQRFDQYLRDIKLQVTPETVTHLKEQGLAARFLTALRRLEKKEFHSRASFLAALRKLVPPADLLPYEHLIQSYIHVRTQAESIRSLEADTKGNVWLGLEQEGLALFNPASGKMNRYRHQPGNQHSLSNNEIMSLELDGNQLWVGTRGGGLNRLDIAQNKVYRYPYLKERNHIKDILKDSKNRIWYGDGFSLSRYNRQEDSFIMYETYNSRSSGQTALAVNALYEDVQGTLWMACFQGGVVRTIVNNPFIHFSQNTSTKNGLTKSSVSTVLKDSKGNLWVGYYTMGIDVWDAQTNTKTHYTSNPQNAYSLGGGTVFKIFESSDGTIWVGTYRGGLQYFDTASKRFVSYRHEPGNPKSINGNDIRDIAEDKQQNLWVAVHGGGVDKLDRKTNTFTHYRANYSDWQHSLANDWVFTVLADDKNRIWAGSVAGVSILEPGKQDFISYSHHNSALSHNNVRSIFSDQKGKVWIGTENGLNRYDEQKKDFVVYTEKNGLANNFIMGGVADKKGNLWISTNNGLSKFDAATQTFRNYSRLDGLQSNEFFPGAYSKGGDNEIYFGGKNGLNVFNPEHIRDNPYKTPVVITDFKLFNKQVLVGKDQSPLSKSISETHEITLSHDQNVMSFEFVGLNLVRPEKNQYAYKMEGFEQNWNYVGNRRDATYTNLDPGSTRFG
ncbi:hypothetical protein GCM10028895_47790 [Pontibacter rugosus]